MYFFVIVSDTSKIYEVLQKQRSVFVLVIVNMYFSSCHVIMLCFLFAGFVVLLCVVVQQSFTLPWRLQGDRGEVRCLQEEELGG